MMKYSVERIEENVALCEDDLGKTVKLRLDELPENIREGDIIVRTENGYTIDTDETSLRRKKMAEMQKKLFNKKN
ncbi:MAG: DUF3006 domain-containing protein [Clostridiaceae bacterium]|nr:DUF3006 domain-containing protein [Clostridiaceae bacterium]MDY5888737.1 DUF3006 domain-containing protein [Oscillospiraceae bacterium]